MAKPWRHLACEVMSIYISSLMHQGQAVTRWRAKLAQVVSITAGLADQWKPFPAGGYRKFKSVDALRYIYVNPVGQIPSSRVI
jgi:hypothetical protein